MSSRSTPTTPLVGVIMGSRSDWETMRHAVRTLEELGVPFEARVVSAHRTPDWLMEYAGSAEDRGLEVIIAGAGGAAHLPGMAAAKTTLPVLGVPVESQALRGMDSLLSIVQMPAGVPVGTLAIGRAGATNAALLAAAIVGRTRPKILDALKALRQARTQEVLDDRDPMHLPDEAPEGTGGDAPHAPGSAGAATRSTEPPTRAAARRARARAASDGAPGAPRARKRGPR